MTNAMNMVIELREAWNKDDERRAENGRLLDRAIKTGLITATEIKADKTGQNCLAAIELMTSI
jgi:hypothetical protein